jgi:hypothetical protein
MISLVDALGARQGSLEAFDISSNALGCEGVVALCLLLSRNSFSIQKLNLSRTNCADKGVTALASIIADPETGFLVKVLLSGNVFSDAGCKSLSAAIEQDCCLKAIFVDSNSHCSPSALSRLHESASKRRQLGGTRIKVTTAACLRAQ